MAAFSASSAVSESRTSPTRMMSGSCRRIDRRPLLKVMPVFSLTPTWVIPGSWTSTGSSSVTMFLSGLRISAIAEYRVFVLPEPVGPVMSTSPCGTDSAERNSASWRGSKPSPSSGGTLSPRVSSRMTTFSP